MVAGVFGLGQLAEKRDDLVRDPLAVRMDLTNNQWA
jgi:hypothetical protein